MTDQSLNTSQGFLGIFKKKSDTMWTKDSESSACQSIFRQQRSLCVLYVTAYGGATSTLEINPLLTIKLLFIVRPKYNFYWTFWCKYRK